MIENQGVGVADFANGFDGYDGILGYVLSKTCMTGPFELTKTISIGPVDLTEGTTDSGEQVPTVTDNAFTTGVIDAALVGISFEPTTEEIVTNGALTFGGIDETKFNGELAYVYVT